MMCINILNVKQLFNHDLLVAWIMFTSLEWKKWKSGAADNVMMGVVCANHIPVIGYV